MSDPLDVLLHRLSVPSRQLTEPAPDAATLQQLVAAAVRVPDHGKLEPFRLLELRGEAKRVFGQRLAERALQRDPQLSEAKQAKEANRYNHAPLVLVVIAKLARDSKVPALEQQLTAGCVAYNLLLGAQALGFGAQWLTGWAAYDEGAAAIIGLAEHEQVIGFIHIGTAQLQAPERERPAVAQLLEAWVP